MKKLSWLVALVVISFLFFRCQKDISFIGGPDAGVSVSPDPITASIQGNITDENDMPAIGALVTAGTSTTITDANGYFRITDALLDKNTSLVTAEKGGYFTGYRVLAATSGSNQVAIKLIKKDLAATIQSSVGGDASLSNGANIKLPANGVVKDGSNTDYNGDVKVYASYINPKSGDIAKMIPGSLVANDKNGKRVVLSSYGMLAVELLSAGGEKLQIKSGSTATLTIPIPFGFSPAAPATIPLWYINEETGIWQEEGMARKQGNNYVGEVKHFSFWNCDQANNAVNLSLTLHTPDDLPLVNAAVRMSGVLTDTSTSASSVYGFTDSLGQVKGLVPANTNLTLEVIGTCGGTIVYSQTILPLTQDKDLGTIKITNQTASLLTLTGTLVNCSNAPVTNGYAVISLNGIRRYVNADANGRFKTSYVTCSSGNQSILISGVDADAQQQSNQTEITVMLPLADVGNIVACGNVAEDQFINYTIDGIDYSITPLNGDSLSGYQQDAYTTRFFGYTLSSSPRRFLGFKAYDANGTGTFQMGELSVSSSDTVFLSVNPQVTFTKFAKTPGEFYEGHFDDLSYSDSAQAQHTISATFKIKQ